MHNSNKKNNNIKADESKSRSRKLKTDHNIYHQNNKIICKIHLIKGALCSLGEETQTQNIYSINEVMKQIFIFCPNWINKLFSEENNFLRTLFDARRVTGSATYKQSKTV